CRPGACRSSAGLAELRAVGRSRSDSRGPGVHRFGLLPPWSSRVTRVHVGGAERGYTPASTPPTTLEYGPRRPRPTNRLLSAGMVPGNQRKPRNAPPSDGGREQTSSDSSGPGGPKRGHSGARQGIPKGRGRKPQNSFKPGVRQRGAKVNEHVARWVRAGHPWIFRDALLRPLENTAPGAVLAVADPDGNHLGFALFEPDGAVALRMLAYTLDFDWNEQTMLGRVRAAKAHRE